MNKPNSKTRKRGFRVLQFIKHLSILMALGLIATVAILVYLYATSLPLADSDRNSRLLDSQGEVIATFSAGGKDSIPVQLQDITPDLVNATLAVEDRKFRRISALTSRVWGGQFLSIFSTCECLREQVH